MFDYNFTLSCIVIGQFKQCEPSISNPALCCLAAYDIISEVQVVIARSMLNIKHLMNKLEICSVSRYIDKRARGRILERF